MKEFKAPDSSVILGIDHGFGNIKTVNTIFSNSVTEKKEEPMMSSDYLFYDRKYYVLNESHKLYNPDKLKDNDFYILTIAAISKELRKRGTNKARVNLAVGLPMKWLGNQKDKFREYLTKNKNIVFSYKGQNYFVEITGCVVMPQCYAAVAENLRDYKGLNLVVDIGNGTMNIMYLMDGKTKEGQYFTEVMGVHQCAVKIHNAILDKFELELPESLLNSYLMKGTADVAEEYLDEMKKCSKEYVKEIFDKLNDIGYNEKLMKLYFMGGGAKIIENFGDYNPERVFFNHDIHANAKGFEYYAYMALCREYKK